MDTICLLAITKLIRQSVIKQAYQGQCYHYENTPIQIHRKFHRKKTENFQIKNSDMFHISAQNIDCGYSLEPPWRGGSNEYPQSMFFLAEIRKILYTPVNPSFTV